MKPAPSVVKHATGVKRTNTCSQHRARENMEPVKNAGKENTARNRFKRGKRKHASSVGQGKTATVVRHGKRKHATSAGRGKTCNRPQPGVKRVKGNRAGRGKHTTGAKSGKTRTSKPRLGLVLLFRDNCGFFTLINY